MVIGSKYQFAIEINSEQFSCKTGIIQFWINNNCIGKKEVTYIKPVLLALKRINNLSSFQSLNIDTNNVDIIFRNILNDEELCTQTLLGFGETFDDYLLRLYVYNSNVIFLWVVLPQGYSSGNKKALKVEYGSISSGYFFAVLNKSLDCISANF